jgi:hypothetical protein
MARTLHICQAKVHKHIVGKSALLVLLGVLVVGALFQSIRPVRAEPPSPTGDPAQDCATAKTNQSIVTCCNEVEAACEKDCASTDLSCPQKCIDNRNTCTGGREGAIIKGGTSGTSISKPVSKPPERQ